jgi:hypothetical protein
MLFSHEASLGAYSSHEGPWVRASSTELSLRKVEPGVLCMVDSGIRKGACKSKLEKHMLKLEHVISDFLPQVDLH